MTFSWLVCSLSYPEFSKSTPVFLLFTALFLCSQGSPWELPSLVFMSPASSSCVTAAWSAWGYWFHLGNRRNWWHNSVMYATDPQSRPFSMLEPFPSCAQLVFLPSWKLEWPHKLSLGKILPYPGAMHLLPSYKPVSTLRNKRAIACKVPGSPVYTGHSLLSFESFQRMEGQGLCFTLLSGEDTLNSV